VAFSARTPSKRTLLGDDKIVSKRRQGIQGDNLRPVNESAKSDGQSSRSVYTGGPRFGRFRRAKLKELSISANLPWEVCDDEKAKEHANKNQISFIRTTLMIAMGVEIDFTVTTKYGKALFRSIQKLE
jgi:hypothetical protein